jgi:hypothetical protein
VSGLTDARQLLTDTMHAAPYNVRVAREPTGTFTAPCARIHPASPWLAPSVLAAGRRTQRWEIWAVLGRTDSKGRYKGLEDLVSRITNALDNLQGWSAIVWERPAPTDMGGVSYLAARGIIETIAEV